MLLGPLQRKFTVCRKIVQSVLLQTRNFQPSNTRFSRTRHIFKMNEAFVRYDKENEKFDISFRYVNEDLHVDRQYNFNRRSNEPIETFLKRIDTNVSKILQKKKYRRKAKAKKSEEKEEEPLETEQVDNIATEKIRILRKDEKIDNNVICKDILEEPSDVILEVFGSKYLLQVNMPWIETMHLPPMIMAGYPVYPTRIEACHMTNKDSTFIWYVEDKAKPVTKSDRWIEIAQGFVYTPTNDTIGLNLKVSCVPKNGDRSGPQVEVTSTSTVKPGPGICPFELRHAFTKEKLKGKSFRVMSYNILANAYADSTYSREVLFPYCPIYALDVSYRKLLFLKEIIGFNSDIVCLQEVDQKTFRNDLHPVLSTENYEGFYTNKGTEVAEGLAVFYNSQRFKQLHSEFIIMSKNVEMKSFSDTWSKVTNEKTRERFLERNTTVQAVVLKSLENPDIFVVGNTHLYFHPDADHIRLLQGYFTLTYIQSIVAKTKEENPDCKVHMILCGDFNSVPECGIYQLYTENHVPHDFIDWNSNPDEKVENISLSHHYKIASACGTPKYTNYTTLYSGCLDYIFYETEHLKVTQVVPMPSDEEVTEQEAIPSIVFPSDHISICADLELTS